MKKSIFIPVSLALVLSACNSKPAAEVTETAEQPTVATDSITAAVERLNVTIGSGQSSTSIDSLTFVDGVLTYHYTSPAGFLDDAESVKWLPSMMVNDLPLLGDGALQQIVESKTVVMGKYVDKDDKSKTHSFKLSDKDVAGKLTK